MKQVKFTIDVAGVDIGKSWLDVVFYHAETHQRFPNTLAGIAELIARLRVLGVQRVGMEASGNYEREVRERTRKGKVEKATRYIALSSLVTPQRLLEVVRAHWSVENDLHWQLDVSFHEDNNRTRKDNAPQNIAVIRRMALDILRAHPDKRSINRKMDMARWSKTFFQELFAYIQ